MTIQEMRDKRIRLVNEADEILKRARNDNGRELLPEEVAQFDRIHEEVEALGARIKREERSAAALAAISDGQGQRTDPTGAGGAENRAGGGVTMPIGGRLTSEQRAAGLQSWLMAGAPIERTPGMIEAARRCGISLDSKQFRIVLPRMALRSLAPASIEEYERRHIRGAAETRDLTAAFASPDAGGYLTVADETMRGLEVALLRHGGMRQVATVIRTATGGDLPMPTVNDTGNTGALLAEAGLVTELDPEFSNLVLEAYKYTSRMILVSVEFLQDSSISVAERIGEMLGTRIARITNAHMTTGDGSSKPRGIMTAAASSGITTASATSITYDNLVDLEHSVDPEYRVGPSAGFMFNDTLLKIMKKIKVPQFSGDTQGVPLWKAGMRDGDPDTINGYPYWINQQVASGAGSRAVAFGDLSKYQIRDVRDVTLLRLDERYAEYHQVAFLAFSRHDGDLLDAGTNPVKYLTMGS